MVPDHAVLTTFIHNTGGTDHEQDMAGAADVIHDIHLASAVRNMKILNTLLMSKIVLWL